MSKNRLEAFSDGVIAIIITIMVLDLKIPSDSSAHTLAGLFPVVSCYALSFVMVAIYWVNHHQLIHMVHEVNPRILWSNNNLLFWLSLVPFATAYMGESHAQSLPVCVYALVSAACASSFYILRSSIIHHHRHDHDFCAVHWPHQRKNLIAITILLVSAVLAWVYIPLAVLFVSLPSVMYFIPARVPAELMHPSS